MNRLLPMAEIASRTMACAPCPIASIRITAATPITIPRMARKLRWRWLVSACHAVSSRLKISVRGIAHQRNQFALQTQPHAFGADSLNLSLGMHGLGLADRPGWPILPAHWPTWLSAPPRALRPLPVSQQSPLPVR